MIRLGRGEVSAALPRLGGSQNDLHRYRVRVMRPATVPAALALIGFALAVPSRAYAAGEDVAELRRMIRELQAQNRKLSQRIDSLEGERAPQKTRVRGQERPPAALDQVEAQQDPSVLAATRDTTGMSLEERVRVLEQGQQAQEQATRQIIQDSLSKIGPKINSNVALSGAIEVVAARSQDFDGPTKDTLELATTELDFDITLGEWVAGSVVLGFDAGTGLVSNRPGIGTSPVVGLPVDRFTLDRANIRIGNFERFPIGVRLGREVLPFGTSTGVARADSLSIANPLTTEVFENRQTSVAIEFAFPTPPLGPPAAPVVIPRSQPLFLAPLVSKFARSLGYQPLPERVVQPVPVTLVADPPPFYGSFAVYKGSEEFGTRTKIEDYNASLGYRTRGHCGKSYEELRSSLLCPWSIDVHVDYNSSVFDSRFLEENYRPYLTQIGRIPGLAASVKASFGPFAVVGEVNSAIEKATFIDGLGIFRSITPMTWQVSLAYQFDWNPWLTEIGAQGSFVAVGYSGSQDMAGIGELVGDVPTRFGFVPKRRLLVTAGEWVTDDLKVAIEYSANWDYPLAAGGTGRLAHGILGSVQLNF
jgi:hypothetical protein